MSLLVCYAPVQCTCPMHLSNAPVQCTCPVHLSNAPVQYTCTVEVLLVWKSCLYWCASTPVQCTCPMHLSNAPVQCTCPMHLSKMVVVVVVVGHLSVSQEFCHLLDGQN